MCLCVLMLTTPHPPDAERPGVDFWTMARADAHRRAPALRPGNRVAQTTKPATTKDTVPGSSQAYAARSQ